MKYILPVLFFVTLLFASAHVSLSHAEEKSIYGINCGIPGKPGADRCCIDNFDDLRVSEPKDGTSGESGNGNPIGNVIGWFTEKMAYVGQLFKKKRLLETEVKNIKRDYGSSVDNLCGKSAFVMAEQEQDANGNVISCTCVENTGRIGWGVCSSGYYNEADPAQLREKNKCQRCIDNKGYWSALGCISFDFGTLISTIIIDIGLLLGSIIVLMCIIFNAIIVQLARGDSQKLQKARENIVSCILGLILIIFSVFILKLIGYSIGDVFDFKIDSII